MISLIIDGKSTIKSYYAAIYIFLWFIFGFILIFFVNFKFVRIQTEKVKKYDDNENNEEV